jgi:hypothetical protein
VSVRVDLDELRARIAEFGHPVLLVSVKPDGRPHVVSVAPGFAEDELVMAVGSGTRANIDATPTVTLVWPGSGGAYCLLVDGQARRNGDAGNDSIAVQPTAAVLHRVTGASAELPSCVPLDERAVVDR